MVQREKARRPLRRRRLLAALLILAACVLYLLGGMTLPFLAHPSVSPAFQAAYDREAFYAEGSPDRAALVTDNGDALDIRLRMISEARERIIFSPSTCGTVRAGGTCSPPCWTPPGGGWRFRSWWTA